MVSPPDANGAPEPKRALFVTFRFPPHGGGGVQRVAYFTRYLPENGWQPHVLTGPLEGARQLLDPSLSSLIPSGTEVTRTRTLPTRRAMRLLGKVRLAGLARTLTPSFPNMEGGWILPAVTAGERLLGEQRFDLIFSSAYPVASHVVAYRLHKRSGLPWVADYRDEWSLRHVLRWPTSVHRALGRRLDRLLVGSASRVVTTSPAHTARFAAEFGGPEDKFTTVTNGYDAADFADSGHVQTRPDEFTLVHVGSVFSWRGADGLLEALRTLVESGDVERLRVMFVGRTGEIGFPDLVERGILQATGYVEHRQAVRYMQSADVLVLINTEESNIPGKSFEYLAAGRPVLALVREGATADLIRHTGAGVVAEPDDVPAIRAALMRLYDRWRGGQLRSSVDRTVIQRFERRSTARQLARVFDRLTGNAGKEDPAREPAAV